MLKRLMVNTKEIFKAETDEPGIACDNCGDITPLDVGLETIKRDESVEFRLGCYGCGRDLYVREQRPERALPTSSVRGRKTLALLNRIDKQLGKNVYTDDEMSELKSLLEEARDELISQSFDSENKD